MLTQLLEQSVGSLGLGSASPSERGLNVKRTVETKLQVRPHLVPVETRY